MAIQFTPELAHFYLRALLSIARADREIDAAEGTRLDEVIRKRFPGTSLADVMFEPPLREAELIKNVDAEGGPFRTAKTASRSIRRRSGGCSSRMRSRSAPRRTGCRPPRRPC
jgi:hypothetical protein